MKREYNSRVSSKNSERLLKNLKNTTGDYFFLLHPVYYACDANRDCELDHVHHLTNGLDSDLKNWAAELQGLI